jgi:hypothetical protein
MLLILAPRLWRGIWKRSAGAWSETPLLKKEWRLARLDAVLMSSMLSFSMRLR